MRKRLLAALLFVCAIGLAVAQTTPLYNWTGLETLRLTLQSGSAVDVPLDTVRNTLGVSPIGAGTTVLVSPTGATPRLGHLFATGAITTWGISLPNPANQGQKFCVSNSTGSNFTTNTTVAVQPGTQTHTLNTSYFAQTINAGASACWVFNMTSSTAGTWFRVQ